MRPQAVRQGSVGLLLLLGIGILVGLVLWLRGINPANRNYQFTVIFENTLGMQPGTAVRYRGVTVGRVLEIQPTANRIEVAVEITRADLRIPNDVRIEANQSGFIGETTVDITPVAQLTEDELAMMPRSRDCNSEVIICQGDRLPGQIGVSYEALLRSTEELTRVLTDPELRLSLKATLDNTAALTEKMIGFTDELTVLTETLGSELGPLAASARQATESTSVAAKQVELTATEANRLLTSNRTNISTTLVNINRSSERLLAILETLQPAVQGGDLLQNLETLSANAASASADLQEITAAFNTPANLLMLQQTLESARDVFQSAQKIMADVDELTGDPTFRNNVRDLINGLSGLVSTTETLEREVQLAHLLTPAEGQSMAALTLMATPLTQPISEADQQNQPSMVITYRGQPYRLTRSHRQPQRSTKPSSQ
ncbi:uncharacterized protein XM38_043980 [Halomicronema hongdechloris C2206]|uniref:Mce/MlaD domain-containing protein n=1 Tax=Halomicronema hongdechloris C2206 TaxID=1641165 RepID=A0A1Z3HSY0_9CYAN|nr:MlaD family protein [Halomicronema hongdechloris]ASC73431.1 uncharacterized protein XM38_043980 [Halomicronema hongdechloris C2206]